MNKEDTSVQRLSRLYDEIINITELYNGANERNKIYYESILGSKWKEVDEVCETMYELEEVDVREIRKTGRKLNRITGLER